MRNFELSTRSEIESKIKALTGTSVGPHARHERTEVSSDYIYTIEFGELVDEWLRKCNVSEEKISTLSSRGKANAYCAGVAWVQSKFTEGFGDENQFRPSSERKREKMPRGFGRRDVQDFSFGEEKEKSLPELLGLPSANSDSDQPIPSDSRS